MTPNRKAIITATILENPYIPHQPFKKQLDLLLTPEKEVMFGGAAGGGKSDAVLMGALQYVEDPNYKSLILRRTYPELTQEEGLIERADEWLQETDAKWSGEKKRWYFPSGATLTFRHMENLKDKFKFKGSAYHFIAFDELTGFLEPQYLYLYRSLRKAEGDPIPLRIWSTSNPGDVGHEWVKKRFIRGEKLFIPSSWKDNPYLDKVEYEKSLNELDWITKRQLKYGDWEANPEGGLFKRKWFTDNLIDNLALKMVKEVRAWDLAATIPKPGTDPDYTVGLKLGIDNQNNMYILDVRRLRTTPKSVEDEILATAQMDGRSCKIVMEQEGGATGKIVIDDYARKLIGYQFRGEPAKKSKEERAKPVSSHAENGLIFVLNKPWANDLIDELEAFKTEGIHDDQVDALSLAFNELFNDKQRTWTVMG